MATVPTQFPEQVILKPPTVGPSPRPVGRRYTKKAKWAFAISLAVLAALAMYEWPRWTQSAVSYETVPVERGSIQAKVTATDTLNPVVDVQVGSQVSGNIKALYSDFNTKVKKGQLVALIDPQIFQAQVDQAEAAVNSQDSAVLGAEAQVQKARTDLVAAIANGKSASQTGRYAARTFEIVLLSASRKYLVLGWLEREFHYA